MLVVYVALIQQRFILSSLLFVTIMEVIAVTFEGIVACI